jgi:hypothetical protein
MFLCNNRFPAAIISCSSIRSARSNFSWNRVQRSSIPCASRTTLRPCPPGPATPCRFILSGLQRREGTCSGRSTCSAWLPYATPLIETATWSSTGQGTIAKRLLKRSAYSSFFSFACFSIYEYLLTGCWLIAGSVFSADRS